MGDDIRMTLQTHMVLRALVSRPQDEHYGFELARDAHLPTGTIYPILARLEGAGWLDSDWETIDERAEGRRRRRYYKLTAHGKRAARETLEATRLAMFPEAAGGHV